MLQFNVDLSVVAVSRYDFTSPKGERLKGGRLVALEASGKESPDFKGSLVQEFSCEFDVFEQMPANWKPGEQVTLIATMKSAKDMNKQTVQKVHLLGVVPSAVAAAPRQSTAKAEAVKA